ncbi:MAG: hypothetical protein GY937_12695 [bacterium]|nr:hypothetical protein [bacterium]
MTSRALRFVPAVLAMALLASAPATAVTYAFSTPISGDSVDVTLSLTDVAGGVQVDVSIPSGEGDLLGLFGNVTTESLVPGMGVTDPSGIVTQWQFQANKVWKVGGGNTMSPVKKWDWGLKLGQTGSPGGVVVESASFTLTGVTVAELTGTDNQGWVFGVRIQGTQPSGGAKVGMPVGGAKVGMPVGGAKVGMPVGTPPVGQAPNVAITSPADGSLLGAGGSPVAVSGTVSGATPLSVDVNGVAAVVTGGTWTASVPLVEGANTLSATATNALGSDSASVSVTLDTTAPVIVIADPADGTLTGTTPVTVSGTVTDAGTVSQVDVNGTLVAVTGGAWSTSVALLEGANTITATATDGTGNSGSASLTITLDTTDPVVSIGSPPDGTVTTLSLLNVSGTVSDASAITGVAVNGVAATFGAGTWSAAVPLVLGSQTITATATDAAGNTGSDSILVTRGDPPTIAITAPADGALEGVTPVSVSGTHTGATGIDVNGVAATITGSTWSASVPLVEGSNTLTATAVNAFGSDAASISVTLDSTAPTLTITSPSDGAILASTPVTVSGAVVDATTTTVTVNGVPATVVGSSYSASVPLVPGPNTLTAIATDALGNTTNTSINVTLQLPPLTVAILSPADGSDTSATTLAVSGNVSDGSASVDVNGVTATLTGTSWTATIPLTVGSNLVTATATRASDTAMATITVVRTSSPPPPPPPDATSVAPPLDLSVATDIEAATSFLYTGASPIQTGVVPGTIETLRAAHLHGTVEDRSGAPLPSVKVTVQDHPEFGETLTQADGDFDLVVNGGERLTLHYEREGYVDAYRTARFVPWRDTVALDDVTLIPRSPTVTAVDLTAAVPIQVAQGDLVTDTLGTRQPTLLVPQGTTALAELPGGGSQALTNLAIRITEHTVGATALEALPATIPDGVDPTFIFEFTADEALTLDATEVQFSQPLPLYLENLHADPVGSAAPIAFYDEETAIWVPATAGLVLEIVSETGGLADLDLDGDGFAESPAELATAGITPDEQTTLATLYDPADELRRYTTTHFSFGCPHKKKPLPPDATPPDQKPGEDGSGNDCDATCGNSIIRSDRQVWGEAVDLVGSPFDLHYESDRAPGYAPSFSLDIPLTGATPPASLTQVDLRVEIAGQIFRQSFGPGANQSTTFTWDGLDLFGRKLQGRHPANVTISYGYNPPGPGFRFFGTTGQRYTVNLGTWDNRFAGLAGWSLSAHHGYDPRARVLYRGDGERRRAADLPNLLDQIVCDTTAPIGTAARFCPNQGANPYYVAAGPDGKLFVMRTGATSTLWELDFEADLATQLTSFPGVNSISDLAIGLDGAFYFAGSHQIHRWTLADGLSTVAGTGVSGFSGDGGPATLAQLAAPRSVTFGPDGSLYIGDVNNFRIRRVAPDGTIDTFAGNGGNWSPGKVVDVPAASTSIFTPAGGGMMVVSPAGELHWTWTNAHQVLKVDAAGILRHVAGTGNNNAGEPLGDGGPAATAKLTFPSGLAFGRQGSLWIAQGNSGNRVRRIEPDGIITTAVGTGVGGNPGDNEIALAANISPIRMVAPADGSIALGTSNRIFRLSPALPGFDAGDLLVPAEDGSELYVFDPFGRHTETREPLTLATLMTFAYTSPGNLLATATDANGNVHTIQRDAQANPTGIQAPFGQLTTLSLDANGFVDQIQNPAGETHTIVSTSEGQITSFSKPGGATFTLTYAADGRLDLDQDPEGGFVDLSRVETATDRSVTTSFPSGKSKTVTIEEPVTGELIDTRTGFDGLATSTIINPDGSESTASPDGTVVTTQEAPDPRFGLSAPIQADLQISTPGGTLFQRTQSRATTTDALGVVTSQTDTIDVNGRIRTVAYDGLSQVVTTTTAEGRLLFDTLDAQGRLVQTEVDGLEPVDLGYDLSGRLQTLSQGTGGSQRLISFGYDGLGNLQSVTDPLLRTVSFQYDTAGRVTRQTLPDSRVIDFTYDLRGNLTSLTPPGQPAHIFRYTLLDQEDEYDPPPVDANDPRTFFTYDLDKNLAQVARPDGKTIDLGYDTAGRLSTVTTPRGTTTQAYDPITGNVDTITAPGGEALAFGYDGSLVTSTTWAGTVNGTVSQTYDDDFRVASQTVSGSTTEIFVYDQDGLLTQAGPETLFRDPVTGLLTGATLGTVTTSHGYNTFGELTSDSASAGATALYANTYMRDTLGRITQKVETIQGVTATYDYVYDLAGRLERVDENGVPARTYAYDSNGNRLSVTEGAMVTSGTYDDQDRLLTYGTNTYTYNLAGDLTSKTDSSLPSGQQTTGYSYDALGNLNQVVLPDATTIDYVIDGQNRRIGKKVNGALVQAFVYQDQLNPVAEYDGAGNLVARFIYGSRTNVPDFIEKGGATYRVLSDHLGSPRLVVDTATNTAAHRMDFDEFGQVVQDTNPGFQPFGFAGGLFDVAIGLVRFGVRDYAAVTGRWTVKDPIRFGGGEENLYFYAHVDPINGIDPSGLQSFPATVFRHVARFLGKKLGEGAAERALGPILGSDPACGSLDCNNDGIPDDNDGDGVHVGVDPDDGDPNNPFPTQPGTCIPVDPFVSPGVGAVPPSQGPGSGASPGGPQPAPGSGVSNGGQTP